MTATKLVISTKAIFNTGDTGETVTRKVEAALRRLGLDYVDVFHFHAVAPAAYDHHRDVLAPALVKLKEQGKVRHIGITETSPNDPEQKMLARAIEEAPLGSHHAGLQPHEPGSAPQDLSGNPALAGSARC